MSQSEPQLQKSQSFYSIYSNQSVLQQISPISSNPPQILYKYEAYTPPGPQPIQSIQSIQRMPKMAQSNINLDDAMQIDESSQKDYQTLGRRVQIQMRRQQKYENNDKKEKKQYIAEENILSQIVMNDRDISDIEYKDDKDEKEMSVCLLKQIDCLSVEQVSPAELREIKNKIQLLKKQQFALQSSLLMANNLLTNSQSRNKILEKQIQSYKESMQRKQGMNGNGNINGKVEQVRIGGSSSVESRRIVQQCSSGGNDNGNGNGKGQAVDKLKGMYKQCCFCQRYCVYQNQGYKIQVSYQRDGVGLVVCIKLTPHHHITNKKSFKFGLQLQTPNPPQNPTLSYQGSLLIQPYSQYPTSTFHIPLTIHQLDQSINKHHTHSILIPLPLSHFLQARLLFAKQQQIKRMIKNLSEYLLEFSGVAVGVVERLKEIWWVGRFVSTIGGKQMVYVQLGKDWDGLERRQVKLKIYGKAGSSLITSIIEFLTFLLTP